MVFFVMSICLSDCIAAYYYGLMCADRIYFGSSTGNLGLHQNTLNLLVVGRMVSVSRLSVFSSNAGFCLYGLEPPNFLAISEPACEVDGKESLFCECLDMGGLRNTIGCNIGGSRNISGLNIATFSQDGITCFSIFCNFLV